MDSKSKTRWHQILGKILEMWLEPVGITVKTEVSVSIEPPRADIVLLRNNHRHWTPEQKQRLPDGLRDCDKSQILIEFKYTESVNRDVIAKMLAYDTIYRESSQVAANDLKSFIVSAKTPKSQTLESFGYTQQSSEGVYTSDNRLLDQIDLILLNELPETAENAMLKCFASRPSENKKAFEAAFGNDLVKDTLDLLLSIIGLKHQLYESKGGPMEQIEEITPDSILEQGIELARVALPKLPIEDRLLGIPNEELARVALPKLPIEDRLLGIPNEELARVALPKLPIEDRLRGISPKDRLDGLPREVIKDYLESLEKEERKDN